MSRASRAILAAGLICGVLDGISATLVSVYYGSTPLRLFQGIARGLLGPSALKGGLATAALGVALHFLIALGAAAVFYAASRGMRVLLTRPLLYGVLYGVAVHLFMRFVVTPLSAIGWRRPTLGPFVVVLLVHMIVVGPTISLTIRRYGR